jgi:FKBP-type peptidyl-prolyl cis-trans isomerase
MPKGVKIEDLRVGDGALAGRRTTVTLRYDGFLRRETGCRARPARSTCPGEM